MSTEKTLHPAAVAAATWWAEQVTGSPLFRATEPGEPDAGPAELASMMATILAASHEPVAGAGERFAVLLAARIDAKIRSQLSVGPDVWISLSVDYGPDLALAEPADEAGISLSRFPWKTHQWIRTDHVTASLGYAAPTRLIWAAEDWQRPPCAAHRFLEGDDQPWTDDICELPQYHEGPCDYTGTATQTCEGCSRTYAGHYNNGKADGYSHSWKPAAAVTA